MHAEPCIPLFHCGSKVKEAASRVRSYSNGSKVSKVKEAASRVRSYSGSRILRRSVRSASHPTAVTSQHHVRSSAQLTVFSVLRVFRLEAQGAQSESALICTASRRAGTY